MDNSNIRTRTKRKLKPSILLKEYVVIPDQDTKQVLYCQSTIKDIKYQETKKHGKFQTDSEKETFTCNICNAQFPSKSILFKHSKSHKGVSRYLCEDCGKSLSSLQAFLEHINIHKNIKPFKCDYCGRESRQSSVHYRHLLTHNDDTLNSYKCSICSKKFKLKEYLRSHILKHLDSTERKQFKCEECSKSFNEKRDLSRHRRSHSSLKPFMCTMCKKNFKFKHNLRAHIRLHTGQQSFKCHMCAEVYPQQSLLESHKKTHKELVQNVELVKVDSQTIHVTSFPLDRRKVSQYQKVNLPPNFSLNDTETLKNSKLSLCLNDVVFPLSVVANSFGTGTHIKVKIIDPHPINSEKMRQSKLPVKAVISEIESQFQEGTSKEIFNSDSRETVLEKKFSNDGPLSDDQLVLESFKYLDGWEKSSTDSLLSYYTALQELTAKLKALSIPLEKEVSKRLQKLLSSLQVDIMNFHNTSENTNEEIKDSIEKINNLYWVLIDIFHSHLKKIIETNN